MIAPVEEFKLAPPGIEPLTTEYAIVLSPVAETVKLILPPAETLPKLPAEVDQVGSSLTVKIALLLLTASQ